VTDRGSICWADLGEARGGKPAKRRPVLVVQSDPFNASRLNTTTAAVITSNTALAAMPKTQSSTSRPWSPSTKPTWKHPPASFLPPSWMTSPEGCAESSGSDSNAPTTALCR
jgi:hypothetical protein